jgi:recombinational DNA repair ATPase RecF
MQVFITTTALQNIALTGMQDTRTFQISEGKIINQR